VSCDQWRDKLIRNLDESYHGFLDASYKKLTSGPNGIDPSKVNSAFSAAQKVTGKELFDDGVPTAQLPPSAWSNASDAFDATFKPQDSAEPGFWGFFSNLNSKGKRLLLSGAMSKAKWSIMMLGMTFLWIFDYYMFEIVSAIKTIAAIGILLGVLYYMFFQKLDLPMSALGLWVFGNGLYIVTGFVLAGIYGKIEGGLADGALGAAGWFLGFKSLTSSVLMTAAFMGVAGTSLAMYLSWKGINFAMNLGSSSVFYPKKAPSPKPS